MILRKFAKFKTRQYLLHALLHYAEVPAIAKFKIPPYILMTDSPNLMLIKVSHYTVSVLTIFL